MNFVVDETMLVKCLGRVKPNAAIVVKKYASRRCVTTPGANMASRLFSVCVEYECDGRPCNEHIVFKVPYLSDYYDLFKTVGLYATETYVYEAFVPALETLANASLSARHYGTFDGDVLALEDLSVRGHHTVDRHKMLNYEQIGRTLETLATFHAASARLVERNARILVPMLQEAKPYWRELTNECLATTVPVLLRALRRERVGANVLANFAGYAERIAHRNLWDDPIPERVCQFRVLNHGGLKPNKIFFANERTTSGGSAATTATPAPAPAAETAVGVGAEAGAAKLLDFQTCRWHSPVLDLIMVTMTSVEFAVFDKHGSELLERYLTALGDTLSRLEYGGTYSRDDFIGDMEASKTFQVLMLFFIGFEAIRQVVNDFDPDKSICWDANEIRQLGESQKFKRWFLEWFWYFTKKGYFD